MNLGGPAHHVALLSGELDRSRYETLLVAGRVSPGEEELREPVEHHRATVRYIEELGAEIRPWHDLRALIVLIRCMRRFRPAIVHTHTAKAGMLGRTAALFARKPRPVVVHTFHGHVLRGYFGRVKTTAFRLIERVLAGVSDRLIGVSSATVDELVELKVAPRSKFVVIPLGLELDDFLALSPEPDPGFRSEVGAGPGDVLFTYVGRLVKIKRPDLMLHAAAIAREQGAPVRVAVVGDGALRAPLERLAQDLGLGDAVCFLGYRRDLTTIAAGSDAALLTSDNEGTPVALIEANAAGRPAVATDVGGVPEIVTTETGLLAAPNDAEAIAQCMVRLSGDAALRRRLGLRAREHVRERFASSRLLKDIDVLYSGLLDSGVADPAGRTGQCSGNREGN